MSNVLGQGITDEMTEEKMSAQVLGMEVEILNMVATEFTDKNFAKIWRKQRIFSGSYLDKYLESR